MEECPEKEFVREGRNVSYVRTCGEDIYKGNIHTMLKVSTGVIIINGKEAATSGVCSAWEESKRFSNIAHTNSFVS